MDGHTLIRKDYQVLVEALEIIAGEKQCLDNLLSNVEVARYALNVIRNTERKQ